MAKPVVALGSLHGMAWLHGMPQIRRKHPPRSLAAAVLPPLLRSLTAAVLPRMSPPAAQLPALAAVQVRPAFSWPACLAKCSSMPGRLQCRAWHSTAAQPCLAKCSGQPPI